MPNLFRKLTSPRSRKYLFYALGEIVLVVIGILIAMQINNWNEAYRDVQLEKTYYCKFLEDVNQDQLLLEKLMAEDSARLRLGNALIHALQQPHPSRAQVISLLRGNIVKIRFRFRPSLSAFDDLKSAGKLAILRDLDLKKKLLKYYAEMESYGDISDLVADASLAAYFSPDQDFMELGLQDLDFVKAALDTTLVERAALRDSNYPSPALRKRLLSEAIFHLNNNARKEQVYEVMMEETKKIKSALTAKCAE